MSIAVTPRAPPRPRGERTTKRYRPPSVFPSAYRRGRHPRPPAGRGLGVRAVPHHAHGGHPRPPPPPEVREGPGAPRLDPDGPRPGLQVRRLRSVSEGRSRKGRDKLDAGYGFFTQPVVVGYEKV